jgi:hypothetical protein
MAARAPDQKPDQRCGQDHFIAYCKKVTVKQALKRNPTGQVWRN